MNHEGGGNCFLWCGNDQVALFKTRGDAVTQGGIELNHMALKMEPESYEATKARPGERRRPRPRPPRRRYVRLLRRPRRPRLAAAVQGLRRLGPTTLAYATNPDCSYSASAKAVISSAMASLARHSAGMPSTPKWAPASWP